ncbi:MAG: hypothetical protein HYY22_02005 [Thaumarchaeota archaeon]|nr:hypothetical protein [Nitrososphaerota archaeon]
MDDREVLSNYLDIIRSDAFLKYEKRLAARAISNLKKSQKSDEVSLVKTIINSFGSLPSFSNKKFGISTRSIFIHDQKSRVIFNSYYDNNPCELGDVIFIISVVLDGKKCFEKFTITQFKNAKSTNNIKWSGIDQKQLYLLSRFPCFRGKKGIIPKKDCFLPNYSGCLGSYGFLYNKGDFAFVSATSLDSFLRGRQDLKGEDLYKLSITAKDFPWPYFYLTSSDAKKIIEMANLFIDISYPLPNLFGNHHYAADIYDFSHKYLTLGIGESTLMEYGSENPQAKRFLDNLIQNLYELGKKKKAKLMKNFAKRYFVGNHPNEDGRRAEAYPDIENNGIGIVHTIINLGNSRPE